MTSNIHKTTTDFINEIAQLKADLAKVTAQRDAAQAERNDRDTEASQLFESLQDMNGRYANKAREVHDLRLKVEEYTQDKAVLSQCFHEAQAAANMWQAKHQEAQQAREELREALAEARAALLNLRDLNWTLQNQVFDLGEEIAASTAEYDELREDYIKVCAEKHDLIGQVQNGGIEFFNNLRLETQLEALQAENEKLEERIHDLEWLQVTDAKLFLTYHAALVEERDANEALYRQVADLQTAVNLASAVTFRLKERLEQETARADVERNCATFWYRKATNNANL